ncbi:hypothetical protein FE633_17315 [Streptomyces montanus]|uniref:Uncharacterized protein n=1 Tax=Streptomyces montanus TaxID=2580423 RepID=A0A5R9FLX0_9ACTN|nr:hypothetical protein [Streptomyces montanus]TLS44907.1 hypothetical protein FE633_17315 [Streptomyces montanus]
MTSWPHDLSKTAPAAERTGAILKAALTAHGVTFRVVKPWRSLPGASLVTTAPGQPGVWIEAHSHTGPRSVSGYDVPLAGLFGVSAVITDDFNTRHVHCDFTEAPADITDPAAAADAIASAVAAHLAAYPSLTGAQWVTIASHPASRTEYREVVTAHGTWAHASSPTGYTTGPSLDTASVWGAYQRRVADLAAETR